MLFPTRVSKAHLRITRLYCAVRAAVKDARRRALADSAAGSHAGVAGSHIVTALIWEVLAVLLCFRAVSASAGTIDSVVKLPVTFGTTGYGAPEFTELAGRAFWGVDHTELRSVMRSSSIVISRAANY